MMPVIQPLGPCPCGHERCDTIGTKLTRRGVLVGCKSPQAVGLRNRRKGQAGEARRHRKLGGEGFTPRDDLMHLYSINVATEDKVGAQVPAKFISFVNSETARQWWQQASKKIPVGSDAFPTLYLEVTPSQSYLVVKLDGRNLR